MIFKKLKFKRHLKQNVEEFFCYFTRNYIILGIDHLFIYIDDIKQTEKVLFRMSTLLFINL